VEVQELNSLLTLAPADPAALPIQYQAGWDPEPTHMDSVGNRKISAPARNQTPTPLSTSPSLVTVLKQLSYLHNSITTDIPPSSNSHRQKFSVKIWIPQAIYSRVTNQHTNAFISPRTTFFGHLMLLDDDDDDDDENNHHDDNDDDNNNNTLDLSSLYVFGTAVWMIHVKQTHASGMLFTHFKLNEKWWL